MNIVKLSLVLFFTLITTLGNLNAQHKNSIQGDFEALKALYNSTQGNGIEVLNSVTELPDPKDATYPFMYLINGEIHSLVFAGSNGFKDDWVNVGAPWVDKTGWDTMTPETMGDATGVEVDADGRVIKLVLQDQKTGDFKGGKISLGNNLAGVLPPAIGNLKKMQWFNVKQNYLYGEIPDVFDGWANLERFSLGGQHWEVTLDDRIEWKESSHVKVSYDDNPFTHSSRGKDIGHETNRFKSALPASLGNSNALELIEIRHQFLMGTLPEEWGNATTIRGIFLSSPKSFPEMENVRIQSQIPTSWGNITNTEFFLLEGVYRGDGWLSGEVPDGIRNWSNISIFSVHNNNLSGPIPAFDNATDIVYFNIAHNNFSGDFPWTSVFNGENRRLSKFQISYNNFSGSLPQTLPYHYRLADFSVHGNSFSGDLPDWASELRGLQIINISYNNFTGSFPAGLLNQGNLKTVFLQGNNLSGPLPEGTWDTDRIRWFRIDGNNFEGEIPEGWKSLFQENDLTTWNDGTYQRYRFENNNLSGRVPGWGKNVNWGGYEMYSFQNNKYTFKDILPVYDELKSYFGGNFKVADQKPFGESGTRSMPEGGRLIIDLSDFHYEGNSYQWTKDGTPINGANAPRLTLSNVSSADEGEYVLRVSNPALPELGTHSSEPITFQIGADDGGNDIVSGDGDDDYDNHNGMGSDEQALLDLYNSTNGDNWYDRTGWNGHSISLEDELAGITVAMRDGELRVTAIDMQKVTTNSYNETLGNNLTGTLPSSLGNLKYVEKLNVKQNRLSGKMPPEIGYMTRLKRLSLAGQQCEIDLDSTGEWYESNQTGRCNSVGDKRRFEETNEFAGPLPSEWGNLENIELIEVRRQYLTGTLPDSWGNLSTLRALFINDSKGSGPDLISGDIPDSWGGMTNMQWFRLTNWHGNVRFTGTFPQSAQDNWSNLNHISIITNEFEGPVPEFPMSTNIKHANFGNNDFTGGFPVTYFNGNNSGLDKFSVRNNNLTGPVPDAPPPSYPDSKNYYTPTSFNISRNNFDEPLPEWVQRISQNIQLQKSGNNIAGLSIETGEMTLNEHPLDTELRQNYPNPFNPTTRIEFALTDQQKVRIEVYNIAGRRVATLVNDVLPAGNHAATFDASSLASGVYLYRFISNTHRFTRKMTIIK